MIFSGEGGPKDDYKNNYCSMSSLRFAKMKKRALLICQNSACSLDISVLTLILKRENNLWKDKKYFRVTLTQQCAEIKQNERKKIRFTSAARETRKSNTESNQRHFF